MQDVIENNNLNSLFSLLITEIKGLKKENAGMDKLLTTEEAMDILRVGKSKLYDMVGKKEIPCVKIDRHIRFDQKDLTKFIESKKGEEFKFEFNINELKGCNYKKSNK
ncbi:MAG: helix-turn-helix domain-containing protein [bacterium]